MAVSKYGSINGECNNNDIQDTGVTTYSGLSGESQRYSNIRQTVAGRRIH